MAKAKKARKKAATKYECKVVKICGQRRKLCYGKNGIKSNTKA